MSDNELTGKVRALRELQAQIEQLQSEAEAIKDDLKAEMAAQGTDVMNVDIFKVYWIPYVSHRFDSTAFKATHADLYSQYTREVRSRRFEVR